MGVWYFCLECENPIHDDDTLTHHEHHGVAGGSSLPESFVKCTCGSLDLDDAYECDECGEVFHHEVMEDDWCLDCFAKLCE